MNPSDEAFMRLIKSSGLPAGEHAFEWMLVGDPDIGFIDKEYRI